MLIRNHFMYRFYIKNALCLFKAVLILGLMFAAFITRPSKIAILYICTGSYVTFWDSFYENMEEKFLPGYEKTYFVFTDDKTRQFPKNVVKIYQKQLAWPFITLKRYHFFQRIIPRLQKYDYVYFLNANMMPVQKIGPEIFPSKEQGLVVTKHPGYYRTKNPHFLPYDRNVHSKAYISQGEGKYYFMGGFNGGTSRAFIQLINDLVQWTNEDLEKGIIPVWHDESYLQRYMIDYMKTKNPLILSEKYGSVKEYGMQDPIMWILPKHKYGVYRYYGK